MTFFFEEVQIDNVAQQQYASSTFSGFNRGRFVSAEKRTFPHTLSYLDLQQETM